MSVKRVTCPCCKGVGYLLVYLEVGERVKRLITPPMPELCCHCQGEGTIPAEVEEPSEES